MQLSKQLPLVACVAGVLQTALVIAAPSISSVSGTAAKSQTMTITGSGFGSKAQAGPMVFDDFESGSSGAQVQGKSGVVGSWDTGDWGAYVTYATTQPLDGTKVARHAFSGGIYNASLYLNPSATQTIYMDFWMRVVPRDNRSRNFKTWRFYDSGDNERGNDVYYCDEPGGVGLDPPWAYKERDYTAGEWMHYEVVAKYGSNGRLVQYRNGVADVNTSGFSNSAQITQIRIGHYWGMDPGLNCPANSGGDVFTDNVYVDNSLSRVVLGNASTFEASTKRAIQRAVSWSDNQVRASILPTRFTNGETAYLFVVDSNNVASPGFRVTINSNTVTPNPPTNVSAQ